MVSIRGQHENDPMNISAARLRWLYLRGPFWWMGLAFALVGLALLLVGLLIWRTEQGFQKHLVRTAAKVTGKEKGRVPKGKNGSETAFFLVYTFPDAAGGQHEGKIRASHEVWKRAKTGDTLAIAYDSTNPATSQRAGTDAQAGWGLLVLGGIGGLFASVGIPLAAFAFFQSGRRARLVRYGLPALGVVDKVAENDAVLKVQGTTPSAALPNRGRWQPAGTQGKPSSSFTTRGTRGAMRRTFLKRAWTTLPSSRNRRSISSPVEDDSDRSMPTTDCPTGDSDRNLLFAVLALQAEEEAHAQGGGGQGCPGAAVGRGAGRRNNPEGWPLSPRSRPGGRLSSAFWCS
jgi:hypothetical protein